MNAPLLETTPYIGPTSCPINSALFFEVARVLAIGRRSQSPEVAALINSLRREFVVAGQFRDDAHLDLYLNGFDPVDRAEEVQRLKCGGRPVIDTVMDVYR